METLPRDMQKVLNFQDEMVKTLQPPARRYVKNAKALFRTPADIYEHPNFYSFVLDVPGLEANDIKVKVENGLHVAGKKKKSTTKPGDLLADQRVQSIRIERTRARYMRKFTQPPDAIQEDVKAIYRDGVLTVNVGKKHKEETSKSKIISVPIS